MCIACWCRASYAGLLGYISVSLWFAWLMVLLVNNVVVFFNSVLGVAHWCLVLTCDVWGCRVCWILVLNFCFRLCSVWVCCCLALLLLYCCGFAVVDLVACCCVLFGSV